MVRVRNAAPTIESVLFATPAQKVLRFLLSEPTTAFSPRVISSRLKGVRGLGGAEGIVEVLEELQAVGLVDFVDNRRAARLRDDGPAAQILKILATVSDLEGLRDLLAPVSSKGVLFGDRAHGRANSDSLYEVCVVTETPEEVTKIAAGHPLGRNLVVTALTPEAFDQVGDNNAKLAAELSRGIVIWGSSW